MRKSYTGAGLHNMKCSAALWNLWRKVKGSSTGGHVHEESEMANQGERTLGRLIVLGKLHPGGGIADIGNSFVVGGNYLRLPPPIARLSAYLHYNCIY